MPEKRHSIHIWLYRALTLLGVILLAACGGVSRPTALPPSDQGYLLTVPIRAGDSQESLAQRYGGEVIAWLEDKAILKLSSQAAAELSKPEVSLQNLVLEADVPIVAPELFAAGFNSWAGGFNSWAGGWNSWAGGWNSWAGGTSSIPVLPNDNRLEFMITKVPQGQAVARNFGQGIKVAVIDTGIDLNHPMFAGRLAPSSEWRDFVDGDGNPQEVSGDMYGHGTAVAGLVLQVAPKATILPIRALSPNGSGVTSNLIGAIKHASESGAHIINLSLGTTDNASSLKNTFVCYLTYPRGCKKEGVLWKPTESTPCTILTQKPSWWLPTSG
ncbi:S8 family serine peptidase, partial [Meiothermus sp.]|uniref:S8 family peptidase n=1 Tax=Meiothermus sp. TaxID=1955249 RepID=UPI00307CE7A6